ncbi:MAG TPA: MATE family efflux transporter [Clostridiales bacterium]|nr:MATE family efflux transporter [Clostridiales bacterium]
MADMIIVGRFSDAAGISAVTNGSMVIFIVNGPITGIITAGTVFIAQYVGSKNTKELKETIGTIFTLFALVAAAIMAGLFVLINPLLYAINIPPEAFDQTRLYVLICAAGMLFSYGYLGISAILRGMGDSRSPLVFIAFTSVANILIDLLLIGGFNLGAVGAAWATMLAQAVGFTFAVVYLKKKGFIFDFRLRSFKLDRKRAAELIKMALPLAVMETVINVSFIIINAIVNRLGVVPSAAVGIAMRFDVFAMMLSSATGMSVTAMVGQNFGARAYDRAKRVLRVSLQISLAFAALLFAWVQISPESVMAIFTSDQAIIASGVPYLRSASLEYLLVAAVFPMNGFFNGCGRTRFTMINGLLATVAVRVPLAYLLGASGLFGIGFAAPLASLFQILIGLGYYIRKKSHWVS